MDDKVAARADIQGEGAGLNMSLDMEIRFDRDDPSDEEVSQSNPTLQRAAPEQTEDLLSTGASEASSYDRPPAIDSEDHQYRVEKLVGKRPCGRTFEYKVKWLGYPDDENTWEKKKDIDSGIVAKYEAGLKLGHH
jgi:hypothetical protein